MRFSSYIQTVTSSGDNNFLEVVRHAFWALILLGGTTVVQFVFDLLLTHRFGAHGSGVFYLCFSVVMALALLGRLGLDRAVVRFIPPLLRSDAGASAGVTKAAVELSLCMTIPLAVVLFLLAPVVANNIFNSSELTTYFRIFAFAIPPFALNYVYSGTLRSLKRTQAALSIERLTMYALGIVGALSLGSVFGLKGTVAGFVTAIFVSTALALWYVRRWHPPYQIIPRFSKRKLLVVSGPLLFVAFSSQMSGQASVLLLGAFGTSAQVGIFNIALKVSMLMNLILAAITAIAGTKISELYASGNKKELDAMIRKISALGALCGIPVFIAIALMPKFLLHLFGGAFGAGAGALIILSAGQLLNVGVGSTDYVLAMTGHERALAVAVGSSLLVNVILGLVLIPVYGVMGAGITAAVTIATSNTMMVLMIKHYLGVWQLPFHYLGVWSKKLVVAR